MKRREAMLYGQRVVVPGDGVTSQDIAEAGVPLAASTGPIEEFQRLAAAMAGGLMREFEEKYPGVPYVLERIPVDEYTLKLVIRPDKQHFGGEDRDARYTER